MAGLLSEPLVPSFASEKGGGNTKGLEGKAREPVGSGDCCSMVYDLLYISFCLGQEVEMRPQCCTCNKSIP